MVDADLRTGRGGGDAGVRHGSGGRGLRRHGMGPGQFPVTIWTRSGRRLEIEAKRLADGSYDEVWLSGEARLVLRGVIN